MSTEVKAKPYISQRRLIKSNRSEYTIGIKFLDNVWLEISKRFYTQEKAIEEMKKIVNLLNAFNIKVKWGVLDEKIKKGNKKDQKESKNQGQKKGKTGSPTRKNGYGSSRIPF